MPNSFFLKQTKKGESEDYISSSVAGFACILRMLDGHGHV